MKNIIKAIGITVLLSGCATTDPQLVKTEYKLVKPSPAMYNCPVVKEYPNPKTLTDIQVARLTLQLYQNNITCRNSIDAIKRFLDDAEKRIESGLY